MNSDAAGFFHETALYGSDDEFLTFAVPFLEDGLRAGEPTLVACAAEHAALLRGALGRDETVTFLSGDQYARPVDAIARYREIFQTHTTAGARQIRVIGEVPHAPWNWWARYEAAANRAYAEFPLWAICPYDTRTTPADVLADVVRTHPHIATASGHHVNPGFRPGFPASTPCPDVLQRGPALVELVNASPSAVRHAVGVAISGTRLSEDAAHDVVYAASELVSNGLNHGVPPVTFRLWADESRAVVAVTDHGPGPADPIAGLMPTAETKSAGLGLWLLHRTCDYVSMNHDEQGFTVRAAVGDPLVTG